MSATNRGSTRSEFDYYITPGWCTSIMLAEFPVEGRVLDAGCGTGEIALHLLNAELLVGVEIHKKRAAVAKQVVPHSKIIRSDFLKSKLIENYAPFDIVVSNPPFSIAVDFWKRSMELVDDGGEIIFFQRSGFVESKKRRFIFEEGSGWHDILFIPKRPSCRYEGGNDSASYCWFRWIKGYKGPVRAKRLFVSGYDE